MEQKKMAAAVAAVNAYLEEEAAAVARSVAMVLPGGPSLWAAAGREQIMNGRQFVTMRLGRG